MKKTAIMAVVISLALAGSAFAVDSGKAQTFDQQKASILKKLDERAKRTQDAQTCVQAAKTADDLKACRAKHAATIAEAEKAKSEPEKTKSEAEKTK